MRNVRAATHRAGSVLLLPIAGGCICLLLPRSVATWTWLPSIGAELHAARPSLPPSLRQLRRKCTCRCQGQGAEAADGEDTKARPCALPLPVGPLCLFRSEFWAGPSMDEYAGDLESKQKILAGLMMKMQMGQRLEREEEEQMCKEMRESNEMWRATNMRMRYAEDFQATEYFKIMEARLLREDVTMSMVEALMVWQPEHMQAMVEKRPPPPPPAGLDAASLQRISQRMPSVLSAMSSTPGLSSSPFFSGSSTLQSSVVEEEYQALMRDHQNIVLFGKGYRSFDPRGKEAFLDQLELIQDRWRVFLTRFQLMGELNPDYVSECEAYLQRLGLSIAEFNELLSEAHQLMRQEAVQEGLQR